MTALPDSIIQNGLFCCWKYEERNGRKTKVPYQPETGLGAKSNLEQYVHKIGNLTVTGYNSTLSNLSFAEKRDRTNSQKLYVGYKNGLEINKNLAEKDAWTVQDIIDRTNELVAQLLVMYKL